MKAQNMIINGNRSPGSSLTRTILEIGDEDRITSSEFENVEIIGGTFFQCALTNCRIVVSPASKGLLTGCLLINSTIHSNAFTDCRKVECVEA